MTHKCLFWLGDLLCAAGLTGRDEAFDVTRLAQPKQAFSGSFQASFSSSMR